MSDPADQNSPSIIELDFDMSPGAGADFDINESNLVSEVFFKESEEILSDLDEQILKIEAFPHDELLLQALFRRVHTLKGSAGAVPGGQLFSSLAHEFESLLDKLRRQKIPPNQSSCELFLHSSRLLKVLAENLRSHREIYPEELSEVIELIGRYGTFQISSTDATSTSTLSRAQLETPELKERKEDGLWLSKEQMSSLFQISSEFITLKNSLNAKDQEVAQKLQVLSGQLQNFLEKAQKVKLEEVFGGLFSLSRQVAYELQKEVELSVSGFDLEVDKFLAQDLSKALIHMIRNSIDHGIESADQRLAFNKPVCGHLQVSLFEEGAFLICNIKDDGQGIDAQKILDRALAKGLINALKASQLSKEEIFEFIFHPGFSTKERVTTLSGRGVGMDVVQTLVHKHGGTIRVESEPGLGCTIQLKLPLPRTLLVERCLLTQWQDIAMAFPLTEVSNIESAHSLKVTEVQGLRFCQANGVTTPLLTLHELREQKILQPLDSLKTMSVVFLKTSLGPLGLLIDKVQYQADLVIKPISKMTNKMPGFKGTSLVNDDLIAFVVEPSELMKWMKERP